MTRRDSFQAIADPTRRAIIEMLVGRPMNLNSIAEQFEISRPAISKQIKILVQCELVKIKQEGRERVCEARLQKLEEISDWIEPYRGFWNKKLDALEDFLKKDNKTGKTKNKKNEQSAIDH